MKLLDRASDAQQRTPDSRLLAQIDLARGIALHQLRRLKESAATLEQALVVFRQADSLGELAPTYDALAAVDADLGDWRSASTTARWRRPRPPGCCAISSISALRA